MLRQENFRELLWWKQEKEKLCEALFVEVRLLKETTEEILGKEETGRANG